LGKWYNWFHPWKWCRGSRCGWGWRWNDYVCGGCVGWRGCVGDGGKYVGKLLEGSALDECGGWERCCVGGSEECSN
jgi:hypothetical protein